MRFWLRHGLRFIIITTIILTIDLCLPDCICHTPESCQNKESGGLVWVGDPVEKDDNDDNVDEGAEEEDGQPTGVLDDRSKRQRAEGVKDTVGDEDITEVVDANGTGDEALKARTKSTVHS